MDNCVQDSLLCLWNPGVECIWQQEAHQGAGIWCMDVSESRSLVVTGGADGGVNVWPLDVNRCSTRRLPPPGDIPRRVSLLRGSHILVCTESGCLMYYNGDTWCPVFTDERISSYCLLEVCPVNKRIALATIHGDVIVLTSK